MKSSAIGVFISCLSICFQASAQNGIITTVAGGTVFTFPTSVTAALNAPFGSVSSVAVDSQGNVYVADTGNVLIFAVSPSGTIRIVAGNGTSGFSGDGGPATAASLSSPAGIAVDSSGSLFIADSGNNRIRKVSASGIITTVAGTGTSGYSGDGAAATAAALSYPLGVAVNAAGNLFIADTYNNRIRKVSASGIITTAAGSGMYGSSGDGGPATAASLDGPGGVALDSTGNLFIADSGNNLIRKVSVAGTISTVAGGGNSGLGDGGSALSASLSDPAALAVDALGNLFIADRYNNRIRKVSTGGTITTVAGNSSYSYSGDGGPAIAASLSSPSGVAVDSSGNLFIADSGNDRIRKVSTGAVISTVAGNGNFGFSGDGGLATAAPFSGLGGIAVDASGNIYIADVGNNRVRKVSPGGVISTVAGNGIHGFSGDGGQATSASLNVPGGLAVDASGNLYIADTENNRIRKVSSGGTITTLAGSGRSGYGGDGGSATSASFNGLGAIAVDGSGNLYIADIYNNRIRKVSASGTITTVAGNGNNNFSGDGGPATAASLSCYGGVAVDRAGNLFISDSASRIRTVSASGIISTFAGTGTYGYSGDGGPATSAWLSGPEGMAVDASGDLVFADTDNSRIREVAISGIVTTAAGIGNTGYSGDGGPAIAALLSYPSGVAADSGGNLYIVDAGNNRIRMVSTPAPSLTVYPGSLTYTLAAGASSNQQISLDATVPGVAWSASSSASWITLAPASGISSGTITAAVKTASLQPGAYTATITISNPSASPSQETIGVSLNISATQTLSVMPSGLNLQSPQGAGAQLQSLQISGTTGTGWTASAATSTGGSWLIASPSSGQIPASLTVVASPGNLGPGTYLGSITVQAPGATPSSATVNIALTVTATQPGNPPSVYSANNSADYSTSIAEGSLFVIFGASLGPVNLAQVTAFPLPNVLAGTAVTVTSGATTFNCPMIYTSAGQVAAILPSGVPAGPAVVNVVYDGVSGYYSPQINVVKSSVGIFTTNSRGLGMGVFTALDGTLKTYAASAKPGDILTIWATGLGPISTPDDILPTSFPNFPDVQVWVGGQSAQIVYAGRSGCCSAIDQIDFTVPATVSGCNVPVVVVSGGASSNTVALPVSGAGGACTDSGPTLPTSALTKAAAGQPIKLAAIAVGPALFGNTNLVPARDVAAHLSAALRMPVSESDVAKLKRAYQARNPRTIRMAMLKYAARWKALDVKTRATLASELGQTQEGAEVLFGMLGNEGLGATIGGALLPVTSSCVILPQAYPSGLGVTTTNLDAGASLLLTGAAGSYTMPQAKKGQYRALFGPSMTGPDIPVGTYTVSGSGGKDIGAFSASVTIGSHLAIANKPSLATIDRTQPLTVTWTGGVAGNYVLILGNSPGSYSDDLAKANFACAEDAGKGTLTIPSYILSSLNATGSGKGTLVLLPHPLSNQITIPGVDLAYFGDGSSDSVSVTFK